MSRFFWQLLISVWLVVILTAVLTWSVSGLLPINNEGLGEPAFADKMVSRVSDGLQQALATDPVNVGKRVSGDYVLDLTPILQIYVLAPDGQDILGRTLPRRVERLAAGQSPVPEGLHLRDEGLQGYRVIGDEGIFVLGRALVKPGGRIALVLTSIVVSIASALMLSRFIVTPLTNLQAAGNRIAEGDLSVRVAPSIGKRSDEIAALVHNFDRMTERLNALLESRHQLLRDVSHELRSPLARLQALISISRQKGASLAPAHLDRMEHELERLDILIGEILTFTRLQAAENLVLQATDLVDLVENIIDDASLEAQPAGKQLRLIAPERCMLHLDNNLMQPAIENVIRNAVRHTADNSEVLVTIETEDKQVRIIVEDQGPGVPEAQLTRIFEPFYRVGEGRDTSSGTGGIGLAISERGIQLHGGNISASNRQPSGLRMLITLPRALA